MIPAKISEKGDRLRVRHLSKTYGNGTFSKEKSTVFRNISFDVHPGEVFGIMGPSGSGKTTLAKILLGMTPADAGNAWIGNENILKLQGKARTVFRRRVQPITQQPETALNPRMRIRESLREVFRVVEDIPHGKVEDQHLVGMLHTVGLGRKHLSRYPRQLSGGELQRVVIARVMSMKPKWVIADEPTSNLDMISQARVIRLILTQVRKLGSGLILISHDRDLIHAVCDRVYHLNEATP